MISIAKDFSPSPAARYKNEGPFTGEHFRDDLLIPALNTGKDVEVDLDGVIGLGSSFLEEAFGGLIRSGFQLVDLKKRLIITKGLETHKKRIWRYIEDASSIIK